MAVMHTGLRVPAYANLVHRGFTRWGECILSNATLLKGMGYRHVWWKGKAYKAHRVAYEEWFGPIPSGYHIDHTCHNEAAHRGECTLGQTCLHRSCVNPAHLRAVSPRQNIYASPLSAPGKPPSGAVKIQLEKTNCSNGHPFSEENTYVFFNKKTGYSTRQCRTCRKANAALLRAGRIANGLTVHGALRSVPFVGRSRKAKGGDRADGH